MGINKYKIVGVGNLLTSFLYCFVLFYNLLNVFTRDGVFLMFLGVVLLFAIVNLWVGLKVLKSQKYFWAGLFLIVIFFCTVLIFPWGPMILQNLKEIIF